MQFQVPQFIETENKIVGPLTLKQFAFVGAGGIVSAILYFTLQTWLWFLGTLIILAIVIAFVFVKIQGRPFLNVVLSAFHFYWRPQTYVWQPEHPTVHASDKREKEEAEKSALEEILAKSTNRMHPATLHPAAQSQSIIHHETRSERPVAAAEEPGVESKSAESKPREAKQSPFARMEARFRAALPGESAGDEAVERHPVSRETVRAGSALHRSWEDVQTGAPLNKKNSDKQFLEKKMAERYQIFQRISGDRHAAKRVDYR